MHGSRPSKHLDGGSRNGANGYENGYANGHANGPPALASAQLPGAVVSMISPRGDRSSPEGDGMMLTPFEKNLEVWRQLWRVLERSQLVVQIVDARNPLLFRCIDLERYVAELCQVKEKRSLLLVNKADLLLVPAAVRLGPDHLRRCGALGPARAEPANRGSRRVAWRSSG
mgnify:CR=1 FL=1